MKLIIIVLLLGVTVLGCGEAVVDISEQSFEPKIVIEGILMPGAPVSNIRINRNFPLNTRVEREDLPIRDAEVVLLDDAGGQFGLGFNPESRAYAYPGSDLTIEHGRSYTLEVTASVEGEALFARSTTTVPNAGFRVLQSESTLGSLRYRQRDATGRVINFEIAFERSPGTNFYALSLLATEADVSTFIYDNPFGEFDEGDVQDDFDDFRAIFSWVQDTPLDPGASSIQIFSFFTWFYGEYRAVVYAGDRNYKDFLVTYQDVQEIDGNFHEPAFHIEGDGIGVFGSAIADTAYFRVVRE